MPGTNIPMGEFMKKSNFFAFISRMKYIDRWGLMRNINKENVSEHSLDVAVIAHALAVIQKNRLNMDVNPEKTALYAIYHDVSEIFTLIPSPSPMTVITLPKPAGPSRTKFRTGLNTTFSNFSFMPSRPHSRL